MPVVKENSVCLEDDVAFAHPTVAESVAARIEAANENGHLDGFKNKCVMFPKHNYLHCCKRTLQLIVFFLV
jgi:hypothetical protein